MAAIGILGAATVFAQRASPTATDLASRVTALGRELRIEPETGQQDLPIYDKAIASGGIARFRALLTQFTQAVLDDDPTGDIATVRARLAQTYSPWRIPGGEVRRRLTALPISPAATSSTLRFGASIDVERRAQGSAHTVVNSVPFHLTK